MTNPKTRDYFLHFKKRIDFIPSREFLYESYFLAKTFWKSLRCVQSYCPDAQIPVSSTKTHTQKSTRNYCDPLLLAPFQNLSLWQGKNKKPFNQTFQFLTAAVFKLGQSEGECVARQLFKLRLRTHHTRPDLQNKTLVATFFLPLWKIPQWSFFNKWPNVTEPNSNVSQNERVWILAAVGNLLPSSLWIYAAITWLKCQNLARMQIFCFVFVVLRIRLVSQFLMRLNFTTQVKSARFGKSRPKD